MSGTARTELHVPELHDRVTLLNGDYDLITDMGDRLGIRSTESPVCMRTNCVRVHRIRAKGIAADNSSYDDRAHPNRARFAHPGPLVPVGTPF